MSSYLNDNEKKEAKRLKFTVNVAWEKMASEMESIFKKKYSNSKIRDFLRVTSEYKEWQQKNTDKTSDNINIKVLKALEKEQTKCELCKKFNITERVLNAIIDDLKEDGFLVIEFNDKLKLCKTAVSGSNIYEEDWEGNKIIRFGVISDCHLGSKWQQLTFLNHLYDVFLTEGITTVYNCGDLVDGYHMHPGHEYEVFKHGADEQGEYVIDIYPKRPGIVTKFITGNHDHSHIKAGGHDIGKPIAAARKDMIYLGLSNVKIYLTPNCTVELNHPLDGAAYALSYAPQKTIDAMTGGEKPNILLNGHHHKLFDMIYRNVQCYEAGTTCAQTPWMRGKRIAANIGGWIIEVHVSEDGTITRCKDEKILLYKPIEHDY
jgi:cell fate (sporulation/competence/biofilm development) regulator YlbF (YheA/YmcA/DUF963 family)